MPFTPTYFLLCELQRRDVDGKLLVTTLLNPRQASKSALKKLFRHRWHVELGLRNLKTTLGLERLCHSGLTPL
jgi:hypothetical protein